MAPPTFEASVEDKAARAIVALIKGDTSKFQAYYGSKPRYVPPLIEDDAIRLPDVMVQNVIEREAMSRMVGGFATGAVHIAVLFFEDDRTTPYKAGEVDTIENRIVHFEKLIEYGSDGEGKGRLLDPDQPLSPVTTANLLNVDKPVITRMRPEPRDIGRSDDQPTIAMVFPVIVSFNSQQSRTTRRTQ